MNNYYKYAPNVFLAKCPTEYLKGDIINVTTKYGKENECIVHNLIFEKDGFWYYSIVRADGINTQTYAQNKANKYLAYADSNKEKSDRFLRASDEGRDFLIMGEPIKIGHHSEKKHRALIERNYNRMTKAMNFLNDAKSYEERASYWEKKTEQINVSMPESIEFYTFQLEKLKKDHSDYKTGIKPFEHSFSLTYAKKRVNECEKNLALAVKLWG